MGKVFYESKNVLYCWLVVPVVRNEDRRFLQSSDNTILSPFFEHFSQI